MTLMGLSNGSTVDDIMLRHTNTGQAHVRLLDTAGGTEEYISKSILYCRTVDPPTGDDERWWSQREYG